MSSFDLVPGEEIILTAKLRKDKWMRWRCATCSCRCVSTVYLAPISVPLYALFGGPCRESEADSFQLILTNQNLHFRQKLYKYGLCCQQTPTKVIPLNRIQDIALISDWIGDCCGVTDSSGEPYQIQVQTAGMGVPFPELCVVSIENPREFKKAVLEAKNKLKAESTGHSKNSLEQKLLSANKEEVTRILNLLQRQENNQVVNDKPSI